MDEGDKADLTEYIKRYSELNSKFQQYKVRKSEHQNRDDGVLQAKAKLDKVQDKLEDLTKKKAWITADQKLDVWEKLNDTRQWIDDMVAKQVGLSLTEDPAFKVSDLDLRIKRVESVLVRVSSTPKPKEEKKKQRPKNIKMDNITIDGNSGDVNWEDFIKINNGNDDDESGDAN